MMVFKFCKRSASSLFAAGALSLIISTASASTESDLATMPHSFSASASGATATITFPSYKFRSAINISGATATSSTVKVTLANGKSVSFRPFMEGSGDWIPAKGVLHLFTVPGRPYPVVAITFGTCGNRSCGYGPLYYDYSKGSYDFGNFQSALYSEHLGADNMHQGISRRDILGSHEEVVRAVVPLLNKEYLVRSEFCGNESLIRYTPGLSPDSARLVKKGDVLEVSDTNPQSSSHLFIAYLKTVYGSDCMGGR